MDIEKFMEMLHRYIREEFIASSDRKGNEIYIRFVDGNILKISVN